MFATHYLHAVLHARHNVQLCLHPLLPPRPTATMNNPPPYQKVNKSVHAFIARQADTLQPTELLPAQTCVFFKISYQKSLVSHSRRKVARPPCCYYLALGSYKFWCCGVLRRQNFEDSRMQIDGHVSQAHVWRGHSLVTATG
jgi:hypothetical protein